jgi:hypothetical protein
LLEAKKGLRNHRLCWLRNVMARGKWPSIFLIGEVDGDGNKEEIAWIKYFRDEGVDLVNGTEGGEGMVGWNPSKEVRHKMSEALKLRIATKGHPASGCHWSAKRIAEMRAFGTGRHISAEACRKISLSKKGLCLSEEHKRKISESKKGKKLSEEHKRKIGAAERGERNWTFGKRFTPEHCKSLSEARKNNPKCRGWKLSEDVRKKHGEVIKKYWQDRKNKFQRSEATP